MRAGAGLLVAMVLLCAAGVPELRAQAAKESAGDDVLLLDEFVVSGAHNEEEDENRDSTGMGRSDSDMEDAPFADALLAEDARHQEEFDVEINNELQLAAGASPADLATAVNRVNLRGFPTPRLRNGFSQTGIPETLNIGYTRLIQGPLTPVAGRAAPGGIRDFNTNRPLGRPRVMFSAYGNSTGMRDVRLEESTAIVQRKYWQRVAAGWRETSGPMTFAHTRTRYLNTQLTLRHSRRGSTMLSVDYLDLSGNPASGVPEYRNAITGKIVGPYMPLATFNTFGPNAEVRKRVLATSLQHERRITRLISMRANLYSYNRRTIDDRFTTGQYIILDDDNRGVDYTGKFGGVRRPRRIAQESKSFIASAEITARIPLEKTDHKITFRIEQIHASYTRSDRTLTTAVANSLLPKDVREFDPFNPNYFTLPYSDEIFTYITANRVESSDYTSIALNERVAFWRGKLVATAGTQVDIMSIDVEDRRTNARYPESSSDAAKLTWFAGANYVVRPGRLLFFASASKAVEPTTRVDERTGYMQGNESTFGYEAGFKGLFLKRRLSATLLLFQYFNQNISRWNPLHNDPIDDADYTQPQYRSAGEERFTGGTLDMKLNIARGFIISSRIAYIDPITTKSPDFPEEVCRVVTRMPKTTIGVTARYDFSRNAPKLLANMGTSVTLTHVGSFVAHYGNYAREYLDYPSNTLVSFSIWRSWRFGSNPRRLMRHTLSASVRNLLNRDQLYSLARPGQQRALTLSYRFIW